MTTTENFDNSLNDESLYPEIHRLVTQVLENTSKSASEELTELITAGGEDTERCYISYMQETHALRRAGLAAAQLLPTIEPSTRRRSLASPPTRTKSERARAVVALLSIAASLALMVIMWRSGGNPAWEETVGNSPAAAGRGGVATLVRANRVQWHPDEAAIPELSRLPPGKRLRIERGQVEILFDSGVELVVAGRSDVVIDSSMHVVGKLGKFSARVSQRGKGFTIKTPATHIIDLGTEFGVEIAPSGSTKVAVFKGAVDLDFNGVASSKTNGWVNRPMERLEVGEAILIDSTGEQSRVVTINNDDFPTPGLTQPTPPQRPSLFMSVRDNIRSPSGKKFYRVVQSGLSDDARAYVDRDHEWNGLDKRGLPKKLQGADYIMAFNDDKFASSYELTLEFTAACTLYIFFDNNMLAPDWLLADFKDTGLDIGLDQASGRYSGESTIATGGGMSIDDTFSVWARHVEVAESLQLGGVVKPKNKESGWNMYGIAATPAKSIHTD